VDRGGDQEKKEGWMPRGEGPQELGLGTFLLTMAFSTNVENGYLNET
jgi:hypothetical protein